jgi:hypothetical protein
MRNNVFFCAALVAGFLFANNIHVQAQDRTRQRTTWKIVELSLTDLLNDGWRPINQSGDRAAISTSGGVGAFDIQTHQYLLVKNGKYITCVIANPRAIEGAYSQCRSLN